MSVVATLVEEGWAEGVRKGKVSVTWRLGRDEVDMALTTIGLDLAKIVFQVHGIDGDGKVLVRRQLRRGEVLKFFQGLLACLVGMEAWGTAHHWAREIAALGHTVTLMPPAYVEPYVKRGKTDAADAEAICEAVTRPTDALRGGQDHRSAGRLDAAQDP